jgi:hypothetical protein
VPQVHLGFLALHDAARPSAQRALTVGIEPSITATIG